MIASLVVEGRSVAGSVDKEEAEEHNDGHGEKNCTIEHIFTQTELANQLQKKTILPFY